MTEKRRGKRYKKRMMVRFGIDDAKNIGFIEDISSSGIRIKTNTVFKPGAKLNMEISIEGSSDILRVEGLVMWARKVPPSMMQRERCGMGITYLKMDQNMHDYIMRLTEGDTGSG